MRATTSDRGRSIWLVVLAALLIRVSPAASGEGDVAELQLDVSIVPVRSLISGTAVYMPARAGRVSFDVTDLHLEELIVDGRPLVPTPKDGKLEVDTRHRVAIRYHGVFKDELDHGIRPGSVLLTGSWYPSPTGLARYRLSARLPKGYQAISEAETVETLDNEDTTLFRFHFPVPQNQGDGIHLVASDRYRVAEGRFGRTRLLVYLPPETAELGAGVLAQLREHLAEYTKLFGDFPFARLAIVEAPVSVSSSMATFVLLSRAAIERRVGHESTLAHEVVHEWLGNTVFIDYDSGNWAEGLTTFLSDLRLNEKRGQGAQSRKLLLNCFRIRIGQQRASPLAQFSAREDDVSHWIGYGKSGLVFHMLRAEIGEDAFLRGVRDLLARRRFQRANWNDLRASFERAAGEDLGWFFRQWIEGAGMPELAVAARRQRMASGRWETTVTLRQAPSMNFRLRVPITIRAISSEQTHEAVLQASEAVFRYQSAEEPIEVVADEHYDVLRRLTWDEAYPVLGQISTAEQPIVVLMRPMTDTYLRVAARFKEKGALFRLFGGGVPFPRDHGLRPPFDAPQRQVMRSLFRDAAAVSSSELREASLIVLDAANPVLRRLGDAVRQSEVAQLLEADVAASIWLDRSSERFVAIVHVGTRERLDEHLAMLEETARESVVQFKSGRVASRAVRESPNGIRVSLR